MFLFLLISITVILASTAAYFSIVGLAALFSFHYWGVVIMGSALEAGKLITTSYLYKFWKQIHWIRRYSMSFLVVLLMVLTSIGIFGYLMQGFQESSSSREISSVQLERNQKELSRTEARLKDIESQIANLPTTSVRGRLQLEKTYREEANVLKVKLSELTKEQSEIRIKSLEADSHIGPIVYAAKELGVEPSKAATYLVLLIVVIFDPLTVLLTISINHVINERQTDKEHGTKPSTRRRLLRRTRRGPVSFDGDNELNNSEAEGEGKPQPEEEITTEKDEKEPGVEKGKTQRPPVRKVIAANSGQLIYED